MFYLLRTKPTFSLSLMKLVGRRDKPFHVMDLHWTLIDRLKECNFCSLSAEQGSYTRSDSGHYNTKVHPVQFCVLCQVWPGKTVLDSSLILHCQDQSYLSLLCAIRLFSLRMVFLYLKCMILNQVIGIGAGQQSRIHCTRLAGDKANNW